MAQYDQAFWATQGFQPKTAAFLASMNGRTRDQWSPQELAQYQDAQYGDYTTQFGAPTDADWTGGSHQQTPAPAGAAASTPANPLAKPGGNGVAVPGAPATGQPNPAPSNPGASAAPPGSSGVTQGTPVPTQNYVTKPMQVTSPATPTNPATGMPYQANMGQESGTAWMSPSSGAQNYASGGKVRPYGSAPEAGNAAPWKMNRPDPVAVSTRPMPVASPGLPHYGNTGIVNPAQTGGVDPISSLGRPVATGFPVAPGRSPLPRTSFPLNPGSTAGIPAPSGVASSVGNPSAAWAALQPTSAGMPIATAQIPGGTGNEGPNTVAASPGNFGPATGVDRGIPDPSGGLGAMMAGARGFTPSIYSNMTSAMAAMPRSPSSTSGIDVGMPSNPSVDQAQRQAQGVANNFGAGMDQMQRQAQGTATGGGAVDQGMHDNGTGFTPSIYTPPADGAGGLGAMMAAQRRGGAPAFAKGGRVRPGAPATLATNGDIGPHVAPHRPRVAILPRHDPASGSTQADAPNMFTESGNYLRHGGRVKG